jgi:hypothetical protein
MADGEGWSGDQRQFHLEEYKCLRGEIDGHTSLMFNVFLGALVISGSIIAWFMANTAGSAQGIGGGLRLVARAAPATVVVAFMIGGYLWFQSLEKLGRYLVRLEENLAAPGFGWEREILKGPRTAGLLAGRNRSMLGLTVLLIANLVFAFLVG